MPELFYRLPQNILAIFKGRNLLWIMLAVALTVVIVTSGGDWEYYCLTRGDLIWRCARPALGLGMFVPVVGCFIVLTAGLAARNARLLTTAWALGQAALVAYLITTCFKALTGRRPPPFHNHFGTYLPGGSGMLDSSHGFQFGWLKGGVFWGWPSGHTTVAFSMALCLVMLYREKKIIVTLALAYAFYIGLGVSVSIHWLSEFVAGAIIGSVIGRTVGKSFVAKMAVLPP